MDIISRVVISLLSVQALQRSNDIYDRVHIDDDTLTLSDRLFDVHYELDRELRAVDLLEHRDCTDLNCAFCNEQFNIGGPARTLPREPPVDSWAATARMMADIFPDEDWDSWKDEMKDREIND